MYGWLGEEEMNDKAIEKIVKMIGEWGINKPWEYLTKDEKQSSRSKSNEVLQAILSDSDIPIWEIEPDAELPKIAPAIRDSAIGHIKLQAYEEMKKAGWVKKKDG